ncbi:hypothetical protein [Bradyrhizobium sp. USDA 329]|uniref:hypothetical protein n=1 Tax=unclassified Bradyrhizobium TaxID=2631580 RepID=UPI0035155518
MSDNLKAGITRACFHEPKVNRTYANLDRHYLSARCRHGRIGRDKAKIEVGETAVR